MKNSWVNVFLVSFCLLFSEFIQAGLRGDSQFTYETGLIFAEDNSGFSNVEALYHLQGNSVIYQFDSQTAANMNHDHTDQITSGVVQETRFYIDSPRTPISLLLQQDYDSGWDIGEQPFSQWQHDMLLGPEILLNTPAIDELTLDVYYVDERDDAQQQQFIEASFVAENRVTSRQDIRLTSWTRQLQFADSLNEYELALRWSRHASNGFLTAHFGRHWLEADKIIDQSFIGSLTFSRMINSSLGLRIGGRQSIEPVNDDSPVPDSLFAETDQFYQLQDYWFDINWNQIEQSWFFHNQYSIGVIEHRKTHTQTHEIVFNRPLDIGRVRPLETEVGLTTLYESRLARANYLRHDLSVALGQQALRELFVQFNSSFSKTPDQNMLSMNISLQWTPVR